MIFTRPDLDQKLLNELARFGVLNPADWEKLQKPEEGQLTEVIARNGPRVSTERWCYWLVKRHAFARVPNPEHNPSLYDRLEWRQSIVKVTEFFGLFPLTVRGSVAHIVALRPDFGEAVEELKAWLHVTHIIPFALSPAELTTWRTFVRLHQ